MDTEFVLNWFLSACWNTKKYEIKTQTLNNFMQEYHQFANETADLLVSLASSYLLLSFSSMKAMKAIVRNHLLLEKNKSVSQLQIFGKFTFQRRQIEVLKLIRLLFIPSKYYGVGFLILHKWIILELQEELANEWDDQGTFKPRYGKPINMYSNNLVCYNTFVLLPNHYENPSSVIIDYTFITYYCSVHINAP